MLQSCANSLLARFPLQRVSLTLAKPAASRFGGAPEVSVTRIRPPTIASTPTTILSSGLHQVYLSFGSNLGNKKHNIETALELLDRSGACKILDTSLLYDSKPMYYEAQDNFLNGVVKVSICCTLIGPVI